MRQVGLKEAIIATSVMFMISCSSTSVSKDAGESNDAGEIIDGGSEDSDTSTSADTDSDTWSGVFENCEDGWCLIKPGSFVLGSPPTEPCRGAYSEEQVKVTLTRAFVMSQTEVTQAQWISMGLPNPSYGPVCSECPVNMVNWYDTLAYCNALSEKEGLDTCYDLSCCTGTVGSGCPKGKEGCFQITENADIFMCDSDSDIHKYDNWYECPGYRLPTGAEWEFAARAGTTTATYNGKITTGGFSCMSDSALDPIAWHCGNSDKKVHLVKQKMPNAWGLYDILGNVGEWNDYMYTGFGLEMNEGKDGPLVDPIGAPYNQYGRQSLRGGFAAQDTCRCKAASHFPDGLDARIFVYGFRPVRTLFE